MDEKLAQLIALIHDNICSKYHFSSKFSTAALCLMYGVLSNYISVFACCVCVCVLCVYTLQYLPVNLAVLMKA